MAEPARLIEYYHVMVKKVTNPRQKYTGCSTRPNLDVLVQSDLHFVSKIGTLCFYRANVDHYRADADHWTCQSLRQNVDHFLAL
ncbi:16104_t:CDS:2 [Acaulospora morrowiae]|uniref:16104_t:CDS:1 n=1 Tax=Acaulospora morrowiae TaxID=94023 RepID=A0A9N9B1L1_9GLOM|nr:16104_t:CDS:2 [Acaulospora morrowiae]